MTIKFDNTTKGAFGSFSNYAKFGVYINGKAWQTVEHFYQAQKFSDSYLSEKIRLAKTANKAWRIGQSRFYASGINWDCKRDAVMFTALHAKFS